MPEIALEIGDLPQSDGGVLRVQEGAHDIAVYRLDGELRAIDNECPHHGAPLSDGWVDEGVVSCPWHCWQFDIQTGQCLSVRGYDVPTYAIELRDGRAFLQIPEIPTA